MSDIDDMFGSDSSDDEFDLQAAAAKHEESNNDGFDDSEEDKAANGKVASSTVAGRPAGGGAEGGAEDDPFADSGSEVDSGVGGSAAGTGNAGEAAVVSGTGLSDSEDDNAPPPPKAPRSGDDDLFGSDSDSGGGEGAAVGGGADDDTFGEGEEERGKGRTLKRLSKGKGKGKGKARLDKEGGGGVKKKKVGKGKDGKKKRKRGDGEGEGSAKKKRKKKKKKQSKAAGGGGGEGKGGGSDADSLGLGGDSESEADLDDLDPNEIDDLLGSADEGANPEKRTRADDDFIDDADDNADLLAEYNQDAPPPGSDSEAEEDNTGAERFDAVPESPMGAVIQAMKKRKAQDLSTAERETIAQEFLFKINKAAEDDEEAVLAGKPAINKLKLLKLVKATLAKKELQETFLEFDLLGVIKRWLQPYSNGQLPNLTIRKEMLTLVLGLPVQVDHLKRSGIGIVVMGLLKCQEETTENKRVLRQLMHRWNRPIYEKETNYRAMRAIHDEPEAMEVMPSGARAGGGGTRRGMARGIPQRDRPGRDESVGNILNATKRGVDPTKSRVPFSNGYAFAKAPRSRVEAHGRAPSQQADTTARTKLLKKMTALSRPVSKG